MEGDCSVVTVTRSVVGATVCTRSEVLRADLICTPQKSVDKVTAEIQAKCLACSVFRVIGAAGDRPSRVQWLGDGRRCLAHVTNLFPFPLESSVYFEREVGL